MPTAKIGVLIEGTTKPGDLIEAFADELERLSKDEEDSRRRSDMGTICSDARSHIYQGPSDVQSEVIETLIDALDDYAPDFVTFGNAEGDGACWGFFPDWDRIETCAADGDLVKLDHVPDDEETAELGIADHVLHVNDHGNATLYRVTENKDLVEVWAVV